MNKKLMLSLSVVAITAVLAIGGSIAYFSDTETSAGNTFKAGKLNLKIDNTCEYNGKVCANGVWRDTQEPCACSWAEKDLAGELFFNLDDVKPGDSGEDTISLHVDNNDAWLCAMLTNLQSNDNGCDSPENKIDTTCGNGQGELQNNLFFTVWRDTNCDNKLDEGIPANEGTPAHCVNSPNSVAPEGACNSLDYDTCLLIGIGGCTWIPTGPGTPAILGETVLVNNQPVTNSLWPIADLGTATGPIKGGTDSCLGVSWNVPIATSNIIQTDSLMADMRFVAVQSRHMDNFKCADLFTEVCDGIDNNYDGQIDESWTDLGQACTAGTGACAAQGIYTCNVSDPSGEAVCSAISGEPGTEICDGQDNDCDGETDEGNPGGGGSCATGLPGICSAGILQCMNNGGLQCVQTSQSMPEICGDGLDNDCDGTVDNNCGFCGDGILQNPEQCDDGNQNNFDLCNSSCQIIPDNDQDGFAGNDCNNNNPAINPAATELCNNTDDDCDGMIDESFPQQGQSCSFNDPILGIPVLSAYQCIQGALYCGSN